MNKPLLKTISADSISLTRRDPVDSQTLAGAAKIVEDVRSGGEKALRACAEKFGDIQKGAPLVIERPALKAALEALPAGEREVLERTAARIREFALAQRACIRELEHKVEGGKAGHTVAPMQRAGCYAPGGRFPLPSSVLMTAITARAAGVESVLVASPKPVPATLAAAAVAGADGLLACGGAHAIAALAYGCKRETGQGWLVEACDAVVGPGNRWVTAAKQLVAGRVAIDMLAGPSELVVLADGRADADTIAADLLAQAEHDTDALPILVALDAGLIERVNAALERQLATLPTAETARAALTNGFAVLAQNMDEAISACDLLAPEHLELMCAGEDEVAKQLRHYGGLFVGPRSAEVFGDYGAGPNHVLPTSGTARRTGGLSVFTFLRVRTWLKLNNAASLVGDAAKLARMEGLEAHARAAEIRGKS